MITLFDWHLGSLSVSVMALVLVAACVILAAIYRRSYVRTSIRWRSFGFSLEATDEDLGRTGARSRTVRKSQ